MSAVSIADLKARLSQYLREAQRGHDLVITDRDRPVARLIPYREPGHVRLQIRPAVRPWSEVAARIPLAGASLGQDVVALLLEERGER